MLSRYLATHIYGSHDLSNRVSAPAVRIAILGMAIGLAVMIISVSVVIGFKHSIRDKVVGFGSHIVVQNFSNVQGSESRPVCIGDSIQKALTSAPGVTHLQPFAYKQGLLKTSTDFLGVMIKGVNEQWDSTFISNSLLAGSTPRFSSDTSSNKLLISNIMATKLNLSVGDKIFAYFLSTDNVRMRRFTICGIYQTNLTRYDETICITDLPTVQKLNGWQQDQANGIELTVSDFDNITPTSRWMIKHINRHTDHYGETYTTATIKDSNPQIFAWLDLLDLNIWIILALMVCIAVVTMVSGLLIIILERVSMIGTLKALGAHNSLIRHTFLWFAFFIIIKGIVIGNILGIGLCLIQRYTGIIHLDPQIYYVSEVPIELDVCIILLMNITTIVIATMTMILPSFLVSHISPTKSMKFT